MVKRKRRRVHRFKIKKSILLLTVVLLLAFIITRAYFQPPVMIYVKQKSFSVASKVINNAIMEQVVPNIDTSKLVTMEENKDGTVTTVTVNTYQTNLLLSKMSQEIHKSINEIERDPNNELNSVTIPFSAMLSNPIVNFGPNIKVNLTVVGSVQTDIVSTVKAYGINNSLFEVVIQSKVKYQIAIPFQADEIEVVTRTPILIKVIHGKVPHFYYTAPNDQINIPDVPG
ncbi:MAG: yunB [Haloplasmataceae bacterium]|jgi:sporulation protein YunB|nr:yunB [Haloplasmataceae bacterium]